MLTIIEFAAGLAAASGILLNNSELFKSSKKNKKDKDSDDLEPSELSYPDDE